MDNNGGFKVSVYPNVDQAFIVALFMIIHKMKSYVKMTGKGIKGAANAINVAKTVISVAGVASAAAAAAAAVLDLNP